MVTSCLRLFCLFRCVFFYYWFNVGVIRLVSGLLSEGIVSLVALELVSLWAKVSSGSSSVAMLNKASFALKKTFSFLRLLCYP